MADVRLAIIGDMHLSDDASFSLLDRVLARIEDDGHDRLVLMGDMTNNGEPELVERIADRLDKHPAPVTVVPGNHDLGNIGEYDRLTRFFGDFVGPGPLARSFDLGDYRCIVLDTNNTIPDPDEWHGFVEAEGMRAFEIELANVGKDRPILLFGHAGLVGKEDELTLEVGNADEVLEKLRGYDLRVAFHGHAHRLRLHWWEGVPFLFIPHMQHTPGYMHCTMRDGEIDIRYQMVAV